MSKKIIILGGLGNGTVIANAIIDAQKRGASEWEFTGYLDDGYEKGSLLECYPILGKTSDCVRFLDEGYYFIYTIFRIDGQKERINLFRSLNIPDSALATFVHPLSYVASDVELGPGTVVLPNVSISSGVKFGRCCLVMVGVTIGHNSVFGNYCHFAAQCCVGAYLKVADGVHFGLNSTVREHLTIGKNATIGMGANLLKDVGDGEIWAGNPAKFLRKAT